MPILDHVRLLLLRLAGVRVRHARRISLGARARLGRGAVLDAGGGTIVLGNDVTVAPGATILTADASGSARPHDGAPTRGSVVIGAGAWLGPRCLVAAGSRIGDGAIVAPETLVTGEVPARTIVAGIPGRPVGRRDAGGCLEFGINASPAERARDRETARPSSPLA